MKTYDFDCGCSFPIFDETIKEQDGLPSMEIDFNNLNYQCPRTWSLLSSGRTKGIFQLEKGLGKNWSAQLQPVSIEELAALISIIRPGCLKAFVDGKNMTQHFVDRKFGRSDFEYFHEKAKPVIESTYGIITYQEQTLALAKIFAGFDLVKADILRRAIGKKKADVMAEMRSIFINGCRETGIISDGDAIALFDIIEKSNRYSFNKCWSLDTTVQTPVGIKVLDDIQIGDMVLAPKDNDLTEDEFVLVEDKIYNGEMELYEVTTESGKTISCTLNHKLLCEDMQMRTLEEILRDGWQIMCQD